jgi:hypothetical protein
MKKQFIIITASLAVIIVLAALFIFGRKQDAQSNFRKGYLKEADTAFLNETWFRPENFTNKPRKK